MSTLRDPVGPKSRKVYIRRRLLVLASLIAVIAVIVLLIVRPGSTAGPADAGSVSVPKDIAGASSEADSADQKSDDPAACAAGQLEVTAVTDKTDYTADETPLLSLSVENTGQQACSADLGTKGMLFEVSSGTDQVWRSSDCQKDPKSTVVILDPGKPIASEPIPWDRTRSSPGTCEVTREPVAADGASYHVRVTAAGVQSTDTAQFLLF